MEKFDLIVIGAGSGLDVMAAAASKGMKVALVEEGPMGGTCLNRGCIPSKILIHSADVMQTIRRSSEFGININGTISVDFAKVMGRSWMVDKEAASIEENIRKSKNIALFKERARFSGPKTVSLKGGDITAEKIVIAAGTRPSIPPITGLDKITHMTSDEALRVKSLPKELLIIGGGYIACELAHFFGSMGSKVTILQRNVRLLPDEDEEIGERFTEIFSKKYPVLLGFSAKSVENNEGRITVYGAEGRGVDGTDLLIATGRVPNSDLLDLGNTGVKTNKSGYIECNDYMETNVPGIWVLGDIAGRYFFKHSANLEAEIVANNLLNPANKVKVDYTAMPHAVFSSPQVAGVGATVQDLKDEDFLVGYYRYDGTGMGEALAEKDGFVKFLTDYDGKILGCHILGPEAATLLHEVLISMKAGKCHVNDIINTVHIHPSLSEVVQRGAGSV